MHVEDWHAHVYYDWDSGWDARLVNGRVDVKFEVDVSDYHDSPIGPHTKAQFCVTFKPEQFGELVQYLILEREGLSVLIHPNTGDDLLDHTERAIWLGTPVLLDLDKL